MTAHEVVARARNLPKISEAALKLVGLLDESKDTSREAVELIKSDSILTAKLLRVCNSPAFALSEPVSSLNQAMLLLGYKQVLSMALSLAVGGSMTGPLPCYGIKQNGLWRHSFFAAIAAETAVQHGLQPGTDSSVAFTAGLLHDMGKLVMAQALAEGVQTIVKKHMTDEGLNSIAAEREVLGTDHADVGACLLHVWRLPEWIVEAVANHHQPVIQPAPQLSAIASLANRLAHLAEAEPATANGATEKEDPVMQAYGLSDKDRAALLAAVRKTAEQTWNLFTVV